MFRFPAPDVRDLIGANTDSFASNGLKLRTVVIDGKPWFKAHDVTAALGVVQGGTTFREHGPEDVLILKERNSLFNSMLDGNRGAPKGIQLLSESGLYKVLLRARRITP